ncbi:MULTISPECIES: hypothetical protein [unclassified Wolbachia]
MSNSNRDINAELRKAALEGNIEKVKSLRGCPETSKFKHIPSLT